MSDDSRRRVEELFHQVVDLGAEERRAFLDGHCEDPELRAEVELLLEHDAEAGDTAALSADFPVIADVRRLLEGVANEPGEKSGRQMGDYRILREIGRGGMGTVYRAFQESLGRTVALKVFPETFAMDPVRLERFRREARATARIRHPNIVPVYEVGETDDCHFYAMELIEGPSLQETLARAREQTQQGRGKRGSTISDPAYAVQVAGRMAELAEGLEEAHAQGLVHRDIKPSNILVGKDGSYVLVDFGLVHDVEAESITGSGQLLGTLSYMSPEQVSGRDVDARSDVYSLGVTLFELLTLERPFEGESVHEIREAILTKEAPSPRSRNSRLSGDLATIVLHCLDKHPDRRYSSAGDLAGDLGRFCRGEPILARPLPLWRRTVRRAWRRRGQLATAAVVLVLASLVAFLAWPKTVISVAVLPFLNEAADPSVEYLCDSVPERLMGMLSSLPELSVRSRSSVFLYKDRDVDPLTAGRDLGADVVVSGRVAQRGDVIDLGLEVVDVRQNAQVWGARYERAVSELMATEEEACREIAERLHVRMRGDDEERLRRRRTESTEADVLYRRGRFLCNQHTPDALKNSVERFDEAIRLDPNFALAYVGLAEAWIGLSYFEEPKEAYLGATKHAENALALDPELGEVYAALGSLRLYHDWDWADARKCLDRALELNPRCVESFPCFTHCLDALGDPDAALAYVEKSLRFNPESPALQEELGCTAYYAGRYEAAVEHSREAIEMDGGFILAYYNLGRSYGQLGEHGKAIETLEKARGLTAGEWNDVLAELAYSYARSGRTAEAEVVLAQLVERKASGTFVDPYPLAFAYIGLGREDEALACLEEALEVCSSWVPWLKVEPKFFGLHDEPRFRALLERLKL